MKAVVQRVKRASVKVGSKNVSAIENGLLTLLGIAKGDDEAKVVKIVDKICHLRIFEDENGKLNKSLKDVGGAHLIVSQFTLLGDSSRGNRPGFTDAEAPEKAKSLYERALELSQRQGVPTSGGEFRAHMEVELVNDGPVTLIIEV